MLSDLHETSVSLLNLHLSSFMEPGLWVLRRYCSSVWRHFCCKHSQLKLPVSELNRHNRLFHPLLPAMPFSLRETPLAPGTPCDSWIIPCFHNSLFTHTWHTHVGCTRRWTLAKSCIISLNSNVIAGAKVMKSPKETEKWGTRNRNMESNVS